ncbi:MAG: hypothetical protein KBA33_08345 [Cloacibacterium sp.]|nr:hypothetical protein [Cloacibacterium sp.]
MKEFLNKIITDTKVKLGDEFDQNFERKAFFDRKWPTPKLYNRLGSPMQRTGKLRRSYLNPKITGNGIVWSSSMPYANLMNNGGEIVVTEKMKRFFWAMYYKSAGAIKGKSDSERNLKLTKEAEQWKALALKKVGDRMKVEQRQVIGHHQQVDKIIKQVIDKNFKELNDDFKHNFLLNK